MRDGAFGNHPQPGTCVKSLMYYAKHLQYNTLMGIPNDLMGMKFGRLRAKCIVGKEAKTRRLLWLCICDCGNELNVSSVSLKNGNTKSCGCLQRDWARKKARDFRTHRATKTPEWNSWQSMKQRCLNPHHKKFKYWGGRGITVCDHWRNSFQNFLSDMGLKPSRSYSLDRFPNNNGNYEPGNCRWATVTQQLRNRRPASEWSSVGQAHALQRDSHGQFLPATTIANSPARPPF